MAIITAPTTTTLTYDHTGYEPGDIVLVDINAWRHGLTGKVRPAVVIGPCDDRIVLMGLTTLSCYHNGSPRWPLIRCGTEGRLSARDGFLWSPRPVHAYPWTIRQRLGRCGRAAAEDIVELCGDNLSVELAADLLAAFTP
jgi:hypothetical protein